MELIITAKELREGLEVHQDYMNIVTEKLYDVDGWTDIEQVNRSQIGGIEVTEFVLTNYEDEEFIKKVYIRYYGVNKNTDDNKVVIDIEID